MPRKTKNDLVDVHFFWNVTLVAGAENLPLRPDNFGSAVVSISDGYDFFRWRRLKFRVFALSAALTGAVCSGSPNVPPTTSADLGQLPASVLHNGPLETMWSRWVTVPPGVFLGPLPWYHTRLGTFSVTEVNPCLLLASGTGTDTAFIEVVGVMEFKDVIPTSATPAAVKLRAEARRLESKAVDARQRDTLLKLLGTSTQ